MASQFALNQYTNFKEAVRYLQSVESTEKSEANNATTDAGHNQGGRGSRRGRGRGRSRGRGNSHNRNQRSSSQKPSSPKQCASRLKEGHWQKDCKKLKRAREAARAAAHKDADNAAQLASVDTTVEFTSVDDPSSSATAYAVGTSSQSKYRWVIDSGASK